MTTPTYQPPGPFTPVHPALPETGYLRLPEVLKLIPVSKSTWWLGIKTGRFPKGVNLGGRVTAWHSDDIRNCIASFQQAPRS